MIVPARIIQSMLLASMVIAAATIWLALRQPNPDVVLIQRYGGVMAIVGAGVNARAAGPVDIVTTDRRIRLEPIDLVRDNDLFKTTDALRRFHVRQTVLAEMLRMPGARVVVAGRALPVVAPTGRLGRVAVFWAIMLPGVIGVAISAVVLAAGPKALPNQLVGFTGLLFQFLTAGPAIAYSRAVAIDGDLYRWLMMTHEIGATLFALAMVVLFAVYPRRIVPTGVLWGTTIAAVVWTIVIGTGHALAWTHRAGDGGIADALIDLNWAAGGSQMTVSVMFVMLCALLAAQYRATRGDPLARAALMWFGLSVVLGAGSFIVLLTLPTLVGVRAVIGGEIAFPLLLFIYAGLTFALLRYRLFEAKIWGFRILFAGFATALLWVVDATVIYGLGLDQGPALGLSLILIGLLYQPMRAALAGSFVGRRRVSENEMFAAAIDVAFASPAIRPVRWRALLERLFAPLEITIDGNAERRSAAIAEDGLALLVPGATGSPGLRIAYPGGGTRLFSPDDRALIDELAALGRQAADALQSYDRGAADERRRMAQDLHDDIGARLLSGIHVADGAVKVLLQDALRDIRTLVTGLIGENAPLSRVVADIRHETALRLEAAGIELDWPLLAPVDATLSYAQAKAVTSVIREAVSNTIRHADARRMTVRVAVADGVGTLDIGDDGRGMAADTIHGTGLNGIATRIAGIGGTLRLRTTDTGLHLALGWPIGPMPEPAPPSARIAHVR